MYLNKYKNEQCAARLHELTQYVNCNIILLMCLCIKEEICVHFIELHS